MLNFVKNLNTLTEIFSATNLKKKRRNKQTKKKADFLDVIESVVSLLGINKQQV